MTLRGTTGDIAIGNDTPYYLSDRYAVTLFTQGVANPTFPSGRSLRFVQLDLFDIENVFSPRPADLLQSVYLPTSHPDLFKISRLAQGSAGERIVFNENNNQIQSTTTSLVAVPEPSTATAGVLLLAFSGCSRLRRTGASQPL